MKLSIQTSIKGLLLLLLLFNITILPAFSLVKMDNESIDLAIKYGLQNKGLGYSNLLGPNWMEGQDGVLLNIYTPFMLLAGHAYRSDFSRRAGKEDIKKARTKFARVIRDLQDPKIPARIKFSVALYGESEAFANEYRGWIEGFGRGKAFKMIPTKLILQKMATKDTSTTANAEHPYEAINAYYFDFADVELLDDYHFVIQGPTGDPISFRINNKKIY